VKSEENLLIIEKIKIKQIPKQIYWCRKIKVEVIQKTKSEKTDQKISLNHWKGIEEERIKKYQLIKALISDLFKRKFRVSKGISEKLDRGEDTAK